MEFVRKYKIEIAAFLAILILFLFLRLYQLGSLPIFTDEALYIRWAQIAKNDANWRFISLTDGKQPSFVWITMVALRAISDPLIAGRLVSVVSGLGSVIGFFFLGREMFKNRWVGIVLSFLYTIFPMAVVYDRMALYDSLVSMFFIWGLFFTILMVRTLRLDTALLFGMVSGGAVLTKTNGFFLLYLLPVSSLLFEFKKPQRIKRLFKLVSLALLAVILTYGYYSILRLSPFFHIISDKNALFVYPFDEWKNHTFRFLYGNLIGLSNWSLEYLTIPVTILIFASFFFSWRYTREKLYLFFVFFIPFFALALFGKTLYPRFIFFMLLTLLPLASLTIVEGFKIIKNKFIYAIILIGLLAYSFYFDFLIITDFRNAPITRVDKDQYISGWPAGGGVKEVVDFFMAEARDKKIYVATQGTFGLMPYALEVYLSGNPNVIIEGFWPLEDKLPKKVIDMKNIMPSYVIFYQPCISCPQIGEAPPDLPLVRIAQYRKGKSEKEFLTLYKVK